MWVNHYQIFAITVARCPTCPLHLVWDYPPHRTGVILEFERFSFSWSSVARSSEWFESSFSVIWHCFFHAVAIGSPAELESPEPLEIKWMFICSYDSMSRIVKVYLAPRSYLVQCEPRICFLFIRLSSSIAPLVAFSGDWRPSGFHHQLSHHYVSLKLKALG